MGETALSFFDQARYALEKAGNLDEVKAIRDKAEAMRVYAHIAGESLTMQNYCAEIKVRAERKAGELLAEMEKAKGATEPGTNRGATRFHRGTASTLSDLGIGKTQSHRWQTMAALPDEQFEPFVLATKGLDKELTSAAVYRAARQHVREMAREARQYATSTPLTEQYTLYQEPCIALGAMDLPPIDWVITDPPYNRDALSLYEDLGKIASQVLKPGGSLLCMSGQSYLPDVLAILTSYLTYHWTLAYLTPGGQSAQIFSRKVNTFWKPVLWFTRGAYAGPWIGDVTRSNVNDNDKRFHHWGQSESGMLDLMRRFVQPGDVVLDPFMGAGTTGQVACTLQARFIGCDPDPTAWRIATARLHEVANGV